MLCPSLPGFLGSWLCGSSTAGHFVPHNGVYEACQDVGKVRRRDDGHRRKAHQEVRVPVNVVTESWWPSLMTVQVRRCRIACLKKGKDTRGWRRSGSRRLANLTTPRKTCLTRNDGGLRILPLLVSAFLDPLTPFVLVLVIL